MNEISKDRLKKVGLITAKVVAGIVAGLALLVGLVLSVLQTEWGGERLRRTVVKRVNGEIRGKFAVERLSFRTNGVVLTGIRLDDPDGRPVARLADLQVGYRLAGLLRKEVHIVKVLIARPSLDLISDERGLNLSRALEPREPKPPKKEPPATRTKEEGWVVRVDQFDLNDGAIQLTTVGAETTVKRVALSNLETAASLRYAAGNGNLETHVSFGGAHTVEPRGTFDVQADAKVVTDSAVHLAIDGHVLDNPLRVHVDVTPRSIETLAADVLISLPTMLIGGYQWGPLRIQGRAQPGHVPTLNVALAIPGIELTGQSESDAAFEFAAAVDFKSLAKTVAAVHGLTGSDVAELAGAGHLTFAVGGAGTETGTGTRAMTAALSAWHARWDGEFPRLHVGETIVDGLSLAGQLRGLELAARLGMKTPEPLKVAVVGVFDGDRRGLTVRELSLAYPQGTWTLDKAAHVRAEDQSLSLSPLRLVSGEQVISVNGSKVGDEFQAALAIEGFRLDRLPVLVAPARLHLAGIVDVETKASGRTDDPNVKATMSLKQLRVQEFSDIGVTAEVSVADHRMAGEVTVHAPFATLDARFASTTAPLTPAAPIDLRADISKLDLGTILSKTQHKPAAVDGAIASDIRVSGSADDPHVDVTIKAHNLRLQPPPAKPAARGRPTAVPAPSNIDIGQARVRLTYAGRVARANLAFTSAQGGELKADAAAKIDLSYPRLTRPPKPSKIPVEGKVVARDFDVAWVAGLSERIETLSGRVRIDAKLAGTVADPQFLGDVRWKDGHVITRPQAP